MVHMRIYLSAPDQSIVPKASWHVFLSLLVSPPVSQLTNYPLTLVLFLIMGFYCPHFYPQKASLFVEIQDPNVFHQSLKGVPNVTLGSNRVSSGKVICSKNLCALILVQGLNLEMHCIRIHEDIKASIPK